MIDPLIYGFVAENLHKEVCLIYVKSARARGFDVTRKITMNMYEFSRFLDWTPKIVVSRCEGDQMGEL